MDTIFSAPLTFLAVLQILYALLLMGELSSVRSPRPKPFPHGHFQEANENCCLCHSRPQGSGTACCSAREVLAAQHRSQLCHHHTGCGSWRAVLLEYCCECLSSMTCQQHECAVADSRNLAGTVLA
jgi:hypothetical protein